MEPLLRREQRYLELALTASVSTTPAIDFARFAGGRIHIPAGGDITSLAFYDAPHADADYSESLDSAGDPITIDVVGESSYPIPEDLFGAAMLKIVADQPGTITLSLKS
jgi:hypothetical protein